MKLLIKNGRVIHPVTGTVLLQDILAEDGRISLMEHGLDCEADRTIDASGLAVALNLHRTLRRTGRRMVIYGCPAQPMRVFEAAGIPKIIPFEEEVKC